MVLMAAAALALVSCAKENINEPNNGGQKFAEVSFKAEIPDYQATKSTIDVDDLTFNTRWAEGDQMGLMCEYLSGETTIETFYLCGTYSKGVFTAKFPEHKGMWYYYGYYPYQSSDDKTYHYVDIPFGAERVQNGNDFNSAYDIMCAKYVGVNDAEQGKTDSGDNITFNMVRQTALLYFHFTTDGLDEPLTKATLTVEGDPIAADTYSLYYYGQNLNSLSHGVSWTTGDSQSITLTFTNAPSSKDFNLWFNILPYAEGVRENGIENIKLVVETETKTFSITNPNTDLDLYEAGKIHSITAKVPDTAWKDKTTPTPPTTKAYYEKVTTAPTDWSGDYLIVYETGSVAFDGSLETLDAVNNGKAVTISTDKKIEATDETDAISFFIEAVDGGYSIQSIKGFYIGKTDNQNGLDSGNTPYVNTISYSSNKPTIKSSNTTLSYNNIDGQKRFRYYKNANSPIALYKRSEGIHTVPTLTVIAPESLSLTAQGGTTEAFTVTTNQETWKAVSDNKEFTVNQTGNGFTVSTSVNPTLSARTTTITVTAGAAKSQTFKITQSAGTFKFAQAREEVILNADKGDTKQVTIVSDYDWEAEIPADAKFSITPSSFIYAEGETATSGTAKSQKVVFKSLENNESEEGTLTLGTVTFSNKQNDTKLTVTVKQETSYVAPAITLSPESLNVPAETTSASFEVQSNVAWTVSTEADWITKCTENGTGDGKVEITFPANEESTARTAEFTVASADGKLSKTFKLTQKASGATVITDVLTANDFTATFSNNQIAYKDFSNVTKTSKAVYAGNSAMDKDGAIQLRSKNNSGIVTTTSGGTAKSVKITISSGSNTIDVYGSNTAYTSASDLYDTKKQGTKIGSVSKSDTVTIEGSYNYIGIRSNKNAVYISSIEIVWE